MLWVAAIMVIVGLAMPHVCLAHNSSSTSSDYTVTVKAQADNHHADHSSKADHCCVTHHCCVGKLADQVVTWVVFSGNKMTVIHPASQNVTGHIPQGLERPPKSII